MLKSMSAEKAIEIWDMLHGSGWVACCLYLIAGWLICRILHKIILAITHKNHLPTQVMKLLDKGIRSVIWAIALIQGLRAIGVDVVGLLGAAGVIGIAIGFASQTSLSNLISGIFLITERSFKLGDYIRVSDKEGSVESINLLSVYLRQPDNALVRIPCETLIKNPVTNITGDTMRRIDLDIGVDYASDLQHVKQIITEVISRHPDLAATPAPSITFTSFGDSSLNLHIGAWCKTEAYHPTRYSFAAALLEAFRKERVNIPFPVRTILTGKE